MTISTPICIFCFSPFWCSLHVTKLPQRQRFRPISTLTEPNSFYACAFGNAARTAPFGMYGPGNYDIDISLRRSFGLPFESSRLTLEGDLYNLINHTQFTVRDTTFGSSSFGTVSGQANSSRDAQLSLRLEF